MTAKWKGLWPEDDQRADVERLLENSEMIIEGAGSASALREILNTLAQDIAEVMGPPGKGSEHVLQATLDMAIVGVMRGKGLPTAAIAKRALGERPELKPEDKNQGSNNEDRVDDQGKEKEEEEETQEVHEEKDPEPETQHKGNGCTEEGPVRGWLFGEEKCSTCKSKLGQFPHACPGAPAEGDIVSICPGCSAQIPRKPGEGGHKAGTHQRWCRNNYPGLWKDVPPAAQAKQAEKEEREKVREVDRKEQKERLSKSKQAAKEEREMRVTINRAMNDNYQRTGSIGPDADDAGHDHEVVREAQGVTSVVPVTSVTSVVPFMAPQAAQCSENPGHYQWMEHGESQSMWGWGVTNPNYCIPVDMPPGWTPAEGFASPPGTIKVKYECTNPFATRAEAERELHLQFSRIQIYATPTFPPMMKNATGGGQDGGPCIKTAKGTINWYWTTGGYLRVDGSPPGTQQLLDRMRRIFPPYVEEEAGTRRKRKRKAPALDDDWD